MIANRPTNFNDWFAEFSQRLAIIAVELLLLFGVIVLSAAAALLLRRIVPWVLSRVGFDRISSRIGLTAAFQRAGLVRAPSRYAGELLCWVAFFVVFIAGAASLDLPWTQQIVERGFSFVPALVAAVVIVVAGALLAEFIARGILIAAVNAGWRAARMLSMIARILVLLLSAAMALEQIGVAPTVVAAAFSILFGGVVFALSLAFGLGGRDLARKYLHDKLGSKPDREPGSELDHL